ncbi:protocadherin Fat 1-like isoform X4 [Lineus longissimus]|uniref:protocadherin Fat 1-like isoform X4 n=1 Tax=Lineus longissimus TaxID=88925 RepID=UPI00315D4407
MAPSMDYRLTTMSRGRKCTWTDKVATWWLLVVIASTLLLPGNGASTSVTKETFKFTQDTYNVTIHENFLAKTYTMPESSRMGIVAYDPNLEIRFRVIYGNEHAFFKAEEKQIGDFCFLQIRTRTNINDVLNRESKDKFHLTVKAIGRLNSGDVEPFETRAQVIVKVLDRNDLMPLFYPTEYSTEIGEDKQLHSTIVQVTASDADEGINGDIYYSFHKKTNMFAIHPTSGTITLTRPLDYSEQNYYELDVLARDRGAKVFTSGISSMSMAKVKIRIVRVNKYAPEINVKRMTLIPDDIKPGTVCAVVTVIDRDTGQNGELNVVHIMHGDPDGHFNLIQVQRDQFSLEVARPLEREVTPVYNLTIQAIDKGMPPQTATVSLFVNLKESHHSVPKFDRKYTMSVDEIIPVNTPLLFVNASGPNILKEDVTYEITGGNVNNYFKMNMNTGLISCANPLDYEMVKNMTLQVTAWDRSNLLLPKHAMTNVSIAIKDYNDNTPIFNSSNAVVSFEENRPVGSFVHQVAAFDLDEGDNGYITYSIANLNPVPFEIDYFSGKIMSKQVLDYEVGKRTFQLVIRASDWGKPFRREAETTVTIKVKDVNDHKPQFEKVDCHGYLSREAPIGTELVVASAIDFDTGSIISYRIVSGNNGDCFKVNSATGSLKLNCDLKDNKEEMLHIQITATDQVNEADPIFVNVTLVNNNRNHQLSNNDVNIQCTETHVTEELSKLLQESSTVNGDILKEVEERKHMDTSDHYNTNNNAPEFRAGLPNLVQILENIPIGASILTLEAHDKDPGYNGKLIYVINAGNIDGCFKIDTYTGELKVFAKIDREIQDKYHLNVTVSDLGEPQLSTDKMITIEIEDVNDCAPQFTMKEYEVIISENSVIGTTVVQVSAEDQDLGENSMIMYMSMNDMSQFTISTISGIITVAGPLDRERQAVHVLHIKASDGAHDNPLTAIAKVTVTLTDVNDNAPKFTPPNYLIKVREDLPIGAVVTILSAHDPDMNEGGLLTYKLLRGTFDKFDIDRQTGVIRIADKLDYETQQLYNITGLARDHGKPSMSVTCQIIIEVIDVNENMYAPKFPYQVTEGSVKENLPIGSSVMKVTAKDYDKAKQDGEVVYSIRDGTGLGVFTIDNEGYIKTNEILDRETTPFYWLTVYAQDRAAVPQSSSIQVYVEVEDENDNIPQAEQPVYYPSVFENSDPGSTVVQVRAYDMDYNPSQRLTYEITGGNPQSFFSINGNTGVVSTTRRRLNRERQQEHILEVTIKDNGTPLLTSTARVVVKVGDVNDNAPEFNEPVYRFRVPEIDSTQFGTPLGRVIAFDKDADNNAEIDYIVRAGRGKFTVGTKTGIIYAKRELRAGKPFSINVRASDNGRPQRKSSVTVLIEVLERPSQSASPPLFKTRALSFTVMENDPVGHLICILSAEDKDSNQLWFDITAGNEDDHFAIDMNRGNILVAKQLDWEKKNKYNLTVSVTDGVHTAYTWVAVTVLDINDNRPEFAQQSYKAEISENSKIGTSVLVVSAIDRDEDKRLFYTIHTATNTASLKKFVIDSDTGLITTRELLDREAIHHHELVIMARDQGTPSKRNFVRIVINVVDHNDHAPVFQSEEFKGSIFETAAIGTSVVQLQAIDRDKGKNAEITFSIISAPPWIDTSNVGGMFKIDSKSGIITIAKELDRDVQDLYTLQVKAVDGGDPALSSTGKVKVMVTVSNNAPPKFEHDEYATELKENLPVNTHVIQVSADSMSSVIYEIVGGTCKDNFMINPNSGVLSTNVEFDYEQTLYCNMSVQAMNMVGTKANTSVIVHILDVNDNHPEFIKKVYIGNISEAAGPNSVILDEENTPLVVRALDNDTNLNALLNYEIIEKEYRLLFDIGSSTGALRNKVQLDREVRQQYEFTVQVKDMGTPSLSSTIPAKVIIKILDINDSPPQFTQDVYMSQLRLPTYHGVTVAELETEDADSPPNAQVTYRISAGDPYNIFKVGEKTGIVTVQQEKNITGDMSLTVEASDGKYKASALVHVGVLRSLDTHLSFTKDVYQGEVKEETPEVQNIAVINVAGSALNRQFRYRIINPNNLFQVGETSGVVQTTAVACDREEKDLYQIIVEVTDETVKAQVAHAIVEVKILDVNDNAPKFVNQPYYAVVSVDAKKGELVKQVTAIDRDIGMNGDVKYRLLYQNQTSGKFKINERTGAIMVENGLSSEDERSGLVLIVEAEDKGIPPMKTNVSVPLQVINKATPIFDKAFYTASIPENSPTHTAVINIEARSPYQRKLIYSISNGDKYNEFAVDFDTDMGKLGPCAITVAEKLDYETTSKYELTLRATDTFTGIHAEVPVTVSLEDINDNAPSFSSQYYTQTISEATTVGSSVMKVSAQDHDSGVNAKIRFEIMPSASLNDSLYFMIDEDDGTIRTKEILDHEQKEQLHFIVRALDGGEPTLFATVKVTIIVTDLNDNAPEFDKPSYETIITDQAKRGQFVTMVTASDADSTDDGNLVYSVVEGNQKQTFSIESNTGIITLSKLRKPDLEPVYTLNISVTDGVFTSFTRVRIVVQSSNHYAPQFSNDIYNIDVAENTVIGQKIAVVTALDRDRGNFGLVTYSINSEESRDIFTIDPSSGEMFTKTTIDRELRDVYEIPVVGVDQGGRTGFATVKVTVTDINDNKPEFVMKQYRNNVHVDAEIGKLVLQVKATDADLGDNAKLEYSIYSTPNTSLVAGELFKIEEYSGRIRVKNNLSDFESELIPFFIKVIDKGKPPKENFVPVEIFIMATDLSPPEFEQRQYEYFLPEDTALGTIINTITAQSNVTIEYHIVAGNVGTTNNPAKFTMNQDGKLTLIEPLDHEDITIYILTIQAKTKSKPPLVDYTEVTIHVMDNNDNSPKFEVNPYSVSIAENSDIGTRVIQVKASDKDSGPNADITYSFADDVANIANVFHLNTQTGWLTTLVELDRETREKYSFTVIARDNGSPKRLSDTTVIDIDISDHNDEPPVFSQKQYTGAVNEDALPGTVIVTISSTDRDLGQNALVSYHITAGDKLGQFNVRRTGEIFVNKHLDREVTPTYELTIEASDGAFVTSVNVVIHILDDNDNDPHCDKAAWTDTDTNDTLTTSIEFSGYSDVFSPIYQSMIPEDIAMNSYIARVQATDRDEKGTRNARIEYLLDGKGSDSFLLERKSGILTTKKQLDRETISEFHLVVHAVDGGGRSCTTDMYISVTDINDNPPLFTMKKYSVAILEDAEVNTLLTRVAATDLDVGINRKVKYSLVGRYSDTFHIDETSGIVSVNTNLDRESRSAYNITLMAKDQGTPSLSSTARLEVVLLDVNDNPPEFERSIYYASIREDLKIGNRVTTVYAMSKDIGINAEISYSIMGGNEQSMFRVDTTTGVIYLVRSLDFETAREYFLTIQANDGGTPSLSASTKVNINVTDFNDNAPKFVKPFYMKKVVENVRRGTEVIKVEASDADSKENGQLSYAIIAGNDEKLFSVMEKDGTVKTTGILDREKNDKYILKIVAVDSGLKRLTSTVQLTVHVLDFNDNPPIFELDNYTAIVQVDEEGNIKGPMFFEGADYGHAVTRFNLTDKDLDPNGPPYIFDINAGNEDRAFRITPEGVLSSIKKFNKALKETYELSIRAFDNGTPPLYSDTNVYVRIVDESMYAPELLPLSLSVNSYEDKFPGGFIGQLKARDRDLYDELTFGLPNASFTLFEVVADSGLIIANSGIDGGKYKLNVSVTDGKFTTYGNVNVEIQTITDEMVANAVIMRLSSVSPKHFVARLKTPFVTTLAKQLQVEMNQVFILGIQPAPRNIDGAVRYRRDVNEDLDILLAVEKSVDNFYRKNPLKRQLERAAPLIEKAIGVPVGKVFNDVCTSELCKNGRCVSVVEFDKSQMVQVKTDDGATYSSLKHELTHKCECKDHFGGTRCEIALNKCAGDPCPHFKVCEPDELQGFQCLCPPGKTGPRCDKDIFRCSDNDPECKKPQQMVPNAMSFRGKGYVLWSILQPIERQLTISLYIRTLQKNSIILFAGKLDRFILEMIDGLIQYRFDLGSGEGIAQVNYYINDGHWHHIKIMRSRNTAELTVDKKYTAQAIAPGYSASMNIENNAVYFGAQVTALNHGYSNAIKGFEGCMKDVLINNESPPMGGKNNIAILQQMNKVKLQCDEEMIGPCVSSPCRNRGTCENRGADFICHCTSRFVGQRCEIDLNPCASKPCMNNGDCENLYNDYLCHCKSQFSGKNCDYGYYCNPNPCHNFGICHEGKAGPFCTCRGFTGKFCDLDIDECLEAPCKNGGTCKNTPGAFNCSCPPEAKGHRCEEVNLSSITSTGINISMDELYGIIGVCVGLLIIVIIIVVVCRWKRRRYARHRHLDGEGSHARSNDIILNHTSDFKSGKMSNLDVATSKNNPNIPPSPKPPPIPNRPASYCPSGQDSMHTLNNFDTIRNYGSAADELESIHNQPIYTEFLQNLNLNQNLQKHLQRAPYNTDGSDSDSLCKPQWELDYPNIVENLDRGKWHLPDKYLKASPAYRQATVANLKNPKETPTKQINNGSISSLPVSENEEDLPVNACSLLTCTNLPSHLTGKKKGYHWDTSDWAPNPALHNITELPVREVLDHSGSDTTRSSNSNATVHEVKLLTDVSDNEFLENGSEYVGDSECAGDSEFADNSDNEESDYPNGIEDYNQFLGTPSGLNYEDLRKHDYNAHLNNYLPTYSISNVSMSDVMDGQSELSDNVQYTDDDLDNREMDGNLSEFTDLENNDDDVTQRLLQPETTGPVAGRSSPTMSDISGLCDIDDSEAPSEDEDNEGTRMVGSRLHTQV